MIIDNLYEDLFKKFKKNKNIQKFLNKKKMDRKKIIKISYDVQTGEYIKFYKRNKNKQKLILKKLTDIIQKKFNNSKTILDFGTGELTSFYDIFKTLGSNKKYFVNDLSLSRLYAGKKFIEKKLKQKIQNINFFTSLYDKLPFEDNSIDLVITCHAIESNNFCKEKIIDELYRVSRNGLCLLEPHYEIANNKQKQRMRSFGYVRGLEALFKKKNYFYEIFKNENFFNEKNPSSIFLIKKKLTQPRKKIFFVDPINKIKLSKIENHYFNPKTKNIFKNFYNIHVFNNNDKQILILPKKR